MSVMPIFKTVLSSLFKKEATLAYPVKPKVNDPLVRGHVAIEIENCIYCSMCQRKCPTGAISVKKDEKSWSIERFDCIQCGSCVESCPKKCLHMSPELTHASATQTLDRVRSADVKADA